MIHFYPTFIRIPGTDPIEAYAKVTKALLDVGAEASIATYQEPDKAPQPVEQLLQEMLVPESMQVIPTKAKHLFIVRDRVRPRVLCPAH